jgi:hypothetical protein
MSLDNLYKNHPARSIELHLESSDAGRPQLLPHAIIRSICDFAMPVLPPAELFVGQALHLFKHVCSPSFRCAHLLEFRRSVLWHRDDNAFWDEIRSMLANDPFKRTALGVVTLLTTCVTGTFAPNSLIVLSIDPLPSGLRLWIQTYAHRSVFANFPGTKLHLILQQELRAAGISVGRSISESLVPRGFPPRIAPAPQDEPVKMRLTRNVVQARFIALRLRFHLVEGLRYLHELRRWRQIRGACSSTKLAMESSLTPDAAIGADGAIRHGALPGQPAPCNLPLANAILKTKE